MKEIVHHAVPSILYGHALQHEEGSFIPRENEHVAAVYVSVTASHCLSSTTIIRLVSFAMASVTSAGAFHLRARCSGVSRPEFFFLHAPGCAASNASVTGHADGNSERLSAARAHCRA